MKRESCKKVLVIPLVAFVLLAIISHACMQSIPVYVDVKPASWPNPLQLKQKGVLPVAVCGTEEFDVTTIDPETIRLTLDGVGVAPLRWSYEDVATPYTGEPCSGHNLTGDGYLDLTLKFKTQEVIQTLGLDAFSDRDVVILILTGNLKAEHGGTPIRGQDCIVILKHTGDVNCDGIVNIVDVLIEALAFGSQPGNSNWNPIADLTLDGIINIEDMSIVAVHFGETY